MSDMPKVSVIVPMYNPGQMIQRGLNSLRNQTLRDIEIILVDDASPDRCGAICDEYTKNHSFIITVHKKNGGLSSARNEGIRLSKGSYLGFVDSDDWIDSDMYSLLYDSIVINESDISISGITREYKNKSII